jgi:hypothetical protein
MVVLYGQKYVTSDNYFRIKLITNFFTLIAYGPLIINIGKVKYYSRVHMITAILIVVLEFVSVKTIRSPYAISWISMLCHVGKIFAMLFLVTRFFGVKLHQLFPLKLIGQILIPSAILLLVERWVLVDLCHLNNFVVLIISSVVYAVVFFGYGVLMKMDYIGLIKPLIKKK